MYDNHHVCNEIDKPMYLGIQMPALKGGTRQSLQSPNPTSTFQRGKQNTDDSIKYSTFAQRYLILQIGGVVAYLPSQA